MKPPSTPRKPSDSAGEPNASEAAASTPAVKLTPSRRVKPSSQDKLSSPTGRSTREGTIKALFESITHKHRRHSRTASASSSATARPKSVGGILASDGKGNMDGSLRRSSTSNRFRNWAATRTSSSDRDTPNSTSEASSSTAKDLPRTHGSRHTAIAHSPPKVSLAPQQGLLSSHLEDATPRAGPSRSDSNPHVLPPAVAIASQQLQNATKSDNNQLDFTMMLAQHEVDQELSPLKPSPYEDPVASSEKALGRLQMATVSLNMAATLSKLGGTSLAAVVGIVQNLNKQAESIVIGRLAALRVVERSADIVAAIQETMVVVDGQISPIMLYNLQTLLTHLQKTERSLTELAGRHFFKEYMHHRDASAAVDQANVYLQHVIQIFTLQTMVQTAAWQQQNQLDREKDTELLLNKMEQALRNDRVLYQLFAGHPLEGREMVKSMQRSYDNLDLVKVKNVDLRRLGSSSPVPDSISKAGHKRSAESLGRQYPLPPFDPDAEEGGTPATRLHAGLMATGFAKSGSPESLGGTSACSSQLSTRVNSLEYHQEFMDRALELMNRTNQDDEEFGIPDWTITNFEITHSEILKTGIHSTVWQGIYENLPVVIRKLDPEVDSEIFVNEVEVWCTLDNAYVLPFLGASSATGPPPWHLITPYAENGTLLSWLKSDQGKAADRYRLAHEIALGMEYLHSHDVIHGNLKSSNILVSGIETPMICDFGMTNAKISISDKKRPADELKPVVRPGGTLRFLAPELLDGGSITRASDVYAFGMTLYELFTRRSPFAKIDDWTIKRDVLVNGIRPLRPKRIKDAMWATIQRCWAQKPADRPGFAEIITELQRLHPYHDLPRKQSNQSLRSAAQTFVTASEGQIPPEPLSTSSSSVELEATRGANSPHSTESIRSIPSLIENDVSTESEHGRKNYVKYLRHEYDPSLFKTALFFPSVVPLASIGYTRHGQFHILYNAKLGPTGPYDSMPPIAYLDEYSQAQVKTEPVGLRSIAAKGLDKTKSWTSALRREGGTKPDVLRRAGRQLLRSTKQAQLIIEDGESEVYASFDAAREYMSANVDWILRQYGERHQVGKTDIMIVVGSISTWHWALSVAGFAKNLGLNFNVYTDPVPGQKWGYWSLYHVPTLHSASSSDVASSSSKGKGKEKETDTAPEIPKWCGKQSREAVSRNQPKQAVLLACLRYQNGYEGPILR